MLDVVDAGGHLDTTYRAQASTLAVRVRTLGQVACCVWRASFSFKVSVFMRLKARGFPPTELPLLCACCHVSCRCWVLFSMFWMGRGFLALLSLQFGMGRYFAYRPEEICSAFGCWSGFFFLKVLLVRVHMICLICRLLT